MASEQNQQQQQQQQQQTRSATRSERGASDAFGAFSGRVEGGSDSLHQESTAKIAIDCLVVMHDVVHCYRELQGTVVVTVADGGDEEGDSGRYGDECGGVGDGEETKEESRMEIKEEKEMKDKTKRTQTSDEEAEEDEENSLDSLDERIRQGVALCADIHHHLGHSISATSNLRDVIADAAGHLCASLLSTRRGGTTGAGDNVEGKGAGRNGGSQSGKSRAAVHASAAVWLKSVLFTGGLHNSLQHASTATAGATIGAGIGGGVSGGGGGRPEGTGGRRGDRRGGRNLLASPSPPPPPIITNRLVVDAPIPTGDEEDEEDEEAMLLAPIPLTRFSSVDREHDFLKTVTGDHGEFTDAFHKLTTTLGSEGARGAGGRALHTSLSLSLADDGDESLDDTGGANGSGGATFTCGAATGDVGGGGDSAFLPNGTRIRADSMSREEQVSLARSVTRLQSLARSSDHAVHRGLASSVKEVR